MQIIALFFSIFGLFGLISNMKILFQSILVSEKRKTGVLILLLLVHLALSIVLLDRYGLAAFYNLMIFVLGPALSFALELHAWKNYEQNILYFLESLLTNIGSGKSFRAALLDIRSGDVRSQRIVNEIADAILNYAPTHKLMRNRALSKLVLELQKISNSSYRMTERIRFLRDQVRINLSFRRKLNQASLQARWQGALLLIIYLGLLSVVVLNSENHLNLKWVLISAIMMFLGVVMSAYLRRSFRWRL